jgi:hypothetical protein
MTVWELAAANTDLCLICSRSQSYSDMAKLFAVIWTFSENQTNRLESGGKI